MKFEHLAYNIHSPEEAVEWYVKNLKMKVVSHVQGSMAFLADSSGRIIFELYRNPSYPCINEKPLEPLTLHHAFAVDDVAQTMKRLIDAGATLVDDVKTTGAGDVMCMLRDPWGIGLQILKRAAPMVAL